MTAQAPPRSTSRTSVFSGTNPLPGLNGISVFVALGVTGLVVDLLICWKYLGLTELTKIAVAETFVIALLIGWLSFSMAESLEDFLARSAVIAFLFCPLVLMALLEFAVFFWLALIVIVALAVIEVLKEAQSQPVWSRLIIAMYAAWVVAGVFVTLGSQRLFGYATSATELSKFHFLLDARYLITVVLLLAAFGEAMFKAFESGLPKLPKAPRLSGFEDSQLPQSGIGMVVRPAFVFANLFIMIGNALVNLVWQVIGYIVTYLYRTAKNLAHEFYSLITNTRIVRAVGKVVGSFAVALVYCWLLTVFAPDLIFYLVNSTSIFSISVNLIVTLARLGFFALATTASVLLITRLWKSNERVVEQAAFGGSMILVGLALSAAVVYVIARTGVLAIIGFESIGILMLLLVLLLGSIFVYHVALLVTKRVK